MLLRMSHGQLARWHKWRACDIGEAKEEFENELWHMKQRKGWTISCDIGKAMEGWRMSCDVGEVMESRAHSPNFPSLHLHHSLFSNRSITLPMSQLILQLFRCFTYVTAHSPTLILLLLRHRLLTCHLASRPWNLIIDMLVKNRLVVESGWEICHATYLVLMLK